MTAHTFHQSAADQHRLRQLNGQHCMTRVMPEQHQVTGHKQLGQAGIVHSLHVPTKESSYQTSHNQASRAARSCWSHITYKQQNISSPPAMIFILDRGQVCLRLGNLRKSSSSGHGPPLSLPADQRKPSHHLTKTNFHLQFLRIIVWTCTGSWLELWPPLSLPTAPANKSMSKQWNVAAKQILLCPTCVSFPQI